MSKIVRIFIMNGGKRQTFAFVLGSFVSYNIDTRELVLSSGSVVVHKDSEDAVIRMYRLLDDDDDAYSVQEVIGFHEAYDKLKHENDILREKCIGRDRNGFLRMFRR